MAGSTAARVTLASLVEGGYLAPADLATRGAAIGEAAAADARDSAAIAVEAAAGEPVEAGVSFGDVFGPSMAVLFLMFATTMGGRRILDEREGGTLSRLLVTPPRPCRSWGASSRDRRPGSSRGRSSWRP